MYVKVQGSVGGGRGVSLVEVRIRCKKFKILALDVSVGVKFVNESLFFYQYVCAVREVSFQYNTFKVTD